MPLIITGTPITLDPSITVTGDHQHYHLSGPERGFQIDFRYDDASQTLLLYLSPWQAESLLLDLLAHLHQFRHDKP